MRLFRRLEIETQGSCNRHCEKCRRNYADGMASWSTDTQLPSPFFYDMIDQLVDMEFTGDVNLSYYNEPLMDPRIYKFGEYVKDRGISVQTHTNGDLIDDANGPRLSAAFEKVKVAIYEIDDIKGKRKEIRGFLGRKQKVDIRFVDKIIMPGHPKAQALSKRYQGNRCRRVSRVMIINHLGEMMLCCADVPGHFNLGNIMSGRSLLDLWYSSKHVGIVRRLRKQGGRQAFSYCSGCSIR